MFMKRDPVKKDFAVIGLGRFGGSICRTLCDQGKEVLAVDKSEERVNEYSVIAAHAIVGDATDESLLRSIGIRNFDHVVVAIGEDIQSSILATLILKELGVNHLTVKAQNDYHEKVLRKIGADDVVHPERDMGIRIANKMTTNNVLDYLDLSDQYSIIEFVPNEKIIGRTLIDLDIRRKYGITIVAIKRDNEVIVSPGAKEMIRKEDILIAIGDINNLNKFKRKVVELI
jgi:trk system potassium uptake protein TrkA